MQAIMSDLDPSKRQASSSPQHPASEHAAAKQSQAEVADAAAQIAAAKQQQSERQNSPSRIPGPPAAAADAVEPYTQAPQRSSSLHMHSHQQQQQQWQQHYILHDEHQQDLSQQHQYEEQQYEQQQQGGRDSFIQSGSAPRNSQHQLLESAGGAVTWQQQADLMAQLAAAGGRASLVEAAGTSPLLFNDIKHSPEQAIPPVDVVARMLDAHEVEMNPQGGRAGTSTMILLPNIAST